MNINTNDEFDFVPNRREKSQFSCQSNVIISNETTSIGVRAFEDCSSLTSITIPNSVTSIETYAFRNCSSLTSITIPCSVTSIKNYAFKGALV